MVMTSSIGFPLIHSVAKRREKKTLELDPLTNKTKTNKINANNPYSKQLL